MKAVGINPAVRRIEMTADRHIRHNGVMIDASFAKDGSIDYYVVEGGVGRFYSIEVAKEIAAHRGKRP
jgi:hypothetical protein